MSVLFRGIHKVIRRMPGGYINGIWTPHIELKQEDIALNIQPASDFHYMQVQAIMGGRRVTAMMVAYADLDAGLHVSGDGDWPGDIIVYNNARWLVIGSSRFDSIGGSITNHYRYIITLEAEHAAAEEMA